MITYTVKGLPEAVATLRRYAELNTKKTFPEIVNAKTLDMAFRALALTERANRQEVANLLYRDWWPKYVAARLAREKGHYTKAEAKKMNKSIISARLRSIAFIAAGWIGAIRDLSRVVPRREQTSRQRSDAKLRGQSKGFGKAASASFSLSKIIALAVNTAINPKRGAPRAAIVARIGAEKAVQASIADMGTYIYRKMKEAAKAAGVPLKDSLTGRVFIPS